MPFWTDHTGQDPKRQFRFIVIIGNMPDGATWYAKKATKPSFSVTEAKHSFLNHNFYYPGRVEWNEVDVTLVDPVSPDAVANTLAIVQNSGYKPPSNFTETTTISKANAVTALGGVVIEMIQSDGSTVERWTLNGAFIKDVSYTDLDYGSDDISELSLKFRYDWAECTTAFDASDASKVGPDGVRNDFFALNPTI